ncbi:DUF1871 domain-containing protein [uncultured Anaerococcus sp.]|uniref:DUF1871 domain-containing protein n=1 Tax=uncultured Anaerococcus sp. TaxID=293428 RepID=UPI00288AFBB8|nr:DUF1871 domain-containing protein [uncultured Anaerococcus sp.]
MDIEKIINSWDPYSLFPFAPKDEYSTEISKIEDFIKKNRDVEALSKYLGKLFDDQIIFQEDKGDFLKIAKIILGLD